MKVVRHVNGPSAWIESSSDDQPSSRMPSGPALREPSGDDAVSRITSHRIEDRRLTAQQAPEVTVQRLEDEAHVEEAYGGRKVITFKPFTPKI